MADRVEVISIESVQQTRDNPLAAMASVTIDGDITLNGLRILLKPGNRIVVNSPKQYSISDATLLSEVRRKVSSAYHRMQAQAPAVEKGMGNPDAWRSRW